MKRKRTTQIILHHSVTPILWLEAKTMANIKGSHDGVSPYHRVIGYNWQWSDSAQDDVKFHAGNYPVNLESIAVCMVGDFTKDDLKDYQKKQLTATLKGWMKQYNIKRGNIKLHKEVRLKPTACPGKIDQDFISILLEEPMPTTDKLSDHIIDGMPADERISALKDQVVRYKKEIEQRDTIIGQKNEDVQKLEDTVKERDRILDEKRDEIALLKAQVGGGITAEDQAKLDLLARLRAILKELS